MGLVTWMLVATALCLTGHASGTFIDTNSVAMRNARWLSENRLNWYHSYIPDLVKLLTAGTNDQDDDEKPGFDPGNVPTVQEIGLRLRTLCARANATFMYLNLTRPCALDLGYFVCRATDLTAALIELGTKNCQKLGSMSQIRACLEHVNKQREANMWTSKFLDAFGKVSGGLLSGSYMHLGSYQQCMELRVKKPKSTNQQTDFTGRYCSAGIAAPLSPTRTAIATTCHGRNLTEACAPSHNSYSVKWGFCVPGTCNTRDANILLYAALYVSGVKNLCPEKPLVRCIEKPDLRSDPPAIAMTVVCAVLGLLAIAATAYDLIDRKILTWEWLGCGRGKAHSKEYVQASTVDSHADALDSTKDQHQDRGLTKKHHRWYTKILLAFSIYTNLKMLLKTNEPGRLRCVDGIRVLTFAWVVLIQAHVLMVDYVGNITKLVRTPAVLAFQIINNGSFSTDTFLLIGGLLQAYAWLRKSPGDEQSTKGSAAKRIGSGILRRLLRLLPVYMFILGLSTAFWGYIGDGPMWTTARYHIGGPFFCKFTWWTNLIFLNNFIGLKYPCMSWTWHIAMDVQCFIMAIPILILYRRRALAGFLVSVVLVVLSIIVNGIIVASYNLPPSLLASTDLNRYDAVNEYYQTVYVKPYMRWNAYLIGIFVAYVLLRTERHPNAMGLKVLRIGPVNVAAWAAIVAICSCIIYGLYGFSIGQQLSAAAVIIYASFARTVWALVIGLLVILCLRTAKGLVSWFLSWSLWIPLSRLTYCAYLLHSFALVFFYGTAKEWLQFSFGNVVYAWLSSLIIAYGLGMIAFVCVEAPGIRIGRAFLDRSASSNNEAATQSFRLLEQNPHAETKNVVR